MAPPETRPTTPPPPPTPKELASPQARLVTAEEEARIAAQLAHSDPAPVSATYHHPPIRLG